MDQTRKTAAGVLAVWAAWSLLDQWFLPAMHPQAELLALCVAAAIAVPWVVVGRTLHARTCARVTSGWQQAMDRL